jgi:hypothetical protein
MPGSTTLPLRDIHLPGAPGWWAPAPGWWLVAGLLILLMLLAYGWYRHYPGRCLQRAALSELAIIAAAFDKAHDDQRLIQALSIWLRRVCISCYPVVDVAGLTGDDWLKFLDKTLVNTTSSQAFSQGPGKVILSAPYQQQCQVNGLELLSLCRFWLMTLPRQPGKSS